MKVIYVIVLACIACLLFACEGVVDVHCKPQGAALYFAHFDSTQIQKITTYKFPRNQQFLQAIDSVILTLRFDTAEITNQSNAHQFGDTVIAGGVGVDYDFIVKAEPVGRSWKISDITYRDEVFQDRRSSIHSYTCPLDAYTVDETQYRGYVIVLK